MLDSFEFSKIAAAVLLALLVIVGGRTFIASHHAHYDPAAGYALPAPPPEESAAGAAPAEKAPEFDPADVVAKIAEAKPEAGKKAFGVCLGCHTADASAGNKAGPNLWNVVNRKLAGRDDFKGYSPELKAKGGEWTYEHLAAFLHKPKKFIPGTGMGFPGIAKTQELADVIAYMRTLADTPAPLPN